MPTFDEISFSNAVDIILCLHESAVSADIAFFPRCK